MTYTVADVPVSATDTRVAYKKVTVTVVWRGRPYPHKSVSLSTAHLPSVGRPSHHRCGPGSREARRRHPYRDRRWTPIRVTYYVDEADLVTMEPKTFGVPPNSAHADPGPCRDQCVTRADIRDPRRRSQPRWAISRRARSGRTGNEFYVYWASSAGGRGGAGDGYYLFSARAFSTTGYVGRSIGR